MRAREEKQESGAMTKKEGKWKNLQESEGNVGEGLTQFQKEEADMRVLMVVEESEEGREKERDSLM